MNVPQRADKVLRVAIKLLIMISGLQKSRLWSSDHDGGQGFDGDIKHTLALVTGFGHITPIHVLLDYI